MENPFETLSNQLNHIQLLIRGIQANVTPKEEEQLLSTDRACNVFDPKVSPVTLRKWEKDGRIQAYRIGGRVYFKRSEIIASLQTLKKYKKFA